MATQTITLEVKAAIEPAVHAALIEFAQMLSDEYGLRMEAVCFDWLATPIVDNPGKAIAQQVRVTSIRKGA